MQILLSGCISKYMWPVWKQNCTKDHPIECRTLKVQFAKLDDITLFKFGLMLKLFMLLNAFVQHNFHYIWTKDQTNHSTKELTLPLRCSWRDSVLLAKAQSASTLPQLMVPSHHREPRLKVMSENEELEYHDEILNEWYKKCYMCTA